MSRAFGMILVRMITGYGERRPEDGWPDQPPRKEACGDTTTPPAATPEAPESRPASAQETAHRGDRGLGLFLHQPVA
jgi:hypothetical protein